MTAEKKERRIGVFICHCGGNISDYVDVEKVRAAVENEPGVVLSRTVMFACSDASQQEMIDAIKEEKLDGLVVASCSPKLHLFTFRSVAERAGLNPYQYVQVNLREQCSWAHREEKDAATEKGIRLVRAGIAKTRLTEPLSRLRIDTKPSALVIGAGIAGLRAALSLADMGLEVHIAEKSDKAGGWCASLGKMFMNDKVGMDIIKTLLTKVESHPKITLHTNTEVIEKSGSVGDFTVKLREKDKEISISVGSIVVATGFEPYQPSEGEYGYGLPGVVTLTQFREILDSGSGSIEVNGKKVNTIVYIYCVGSREIEAPEGREPHTYCSRYCCNAATHTAIIASERDSNINQYHLFRDMRTYGKHELLYEKAGRSGSVFARFEETDPPEVSNENGVLTVKVRDQLAGEEIEIPADLVVLVNGMVPRENSKLTDVLKLPVGRDGFYNEIHPKLRPVETVIDGVFIVGTAQGPKTAAESVASALAGVSKSAALLLKGYVDLEPFVAEVDSAKCTWCGKCEEACPYGAIEKVKYEDKEVAKVIPSLCKGGGACVPVCPEDAIDLKGNTDEQVKSAIDALIREVA